MRNPDSPLALILAIFHPAAILLAIVMTVYVIGLFVVATIKTFALHFLTPETAILLGLFVAIAVMFLIVQALPKSSSKNGDPK